MIVEYNFYLYVIVQYGNIFTRKFLKKYRQSSNWGYVYDTASTTSIRFSHSFYGFENSSWGPHYHDFQISLPPMLQYKIGSVYFIFYTNISAQ